MRAQATRAGGRYEASVRGAFECESEDDLPCPCECQDQSTGVCTAPLVEFLTNNDRLAMMEFRCILRASVGQAAAS